LKSPYFRRYSGGFYADLEAAARQARRYT